MVQIFPLAVLLQFCFNNALAGFTYSKPSYLNPDKSAKLFWPAKYGSESKTVDGAKSIYRWNNDNLHKSETDILRRLNSVASSFHPSEPTKPYATAADWTTEQPHNLFNPKRSQAKRKPKKETIGGRFMDSDQEFSELDEHAEEIAHHFEGDIKLFDEQSERILQEVSAPTNQNRRSKRKFIGPLARRWPINTPIEYSFDGAHTLKEQRIIELALAHWANITCLNFVRRYDEPRGNRIVFTDVDGCASNVGRHPLGEPQFVSLAVECMRLGVIAHEVAHALGFWHEQSRPDRDSFVSVQWPNIDRNSKGQFLKEQSDDVDTAGVPYDYGSIMHYRSKAFAQFDDLFTIETNKVHYQRTIGQRDQLSFNDIRLMNKIYCNHICPDLPCQRGGYVDPRRCDRCKCADGFTGRHCERVMEGYGAKCGGVVDLSTSWSSVHSPNYPDEFKEGQECSWMLRAPPGEHVELQFVGAFDMYCKARHALCMDYVEIRNSTDFANTGMRYCCYGTPQGSVFSGTNEMLLLFRSFYQSGRGFQIRARSVEPSGSWSSWGPWTVCSGSCGGCGRRQRTRTCPNGAVCHGGSTQSEPCNLNPCDMCVVTRFETAPCGGFLSLLRGVRCNVERTALEKCKQKCCTGLHDVGGTCATGSNWLEPLRPHTTGEGRIARHKNINKKTVQIFPQDAIPARQDNHRFTITNINHDIWQCPLCSDLIYYDHSRPCTLQ